jgi:AcrR family transcriptional regulator
MKKATSNSRASSADTKSRILKAAREAFATVGYERATVRKVAEMANIHPSMVMRYFDSKERLFAVSSGFDLHLPDFAGVPRARIGEALVGAFLDRWEIRGEAGDMPALLRLSVTHPDGRQKAIEVFTQQVSPALRAVIRSSHPEVCTALIATQLVGMAFLRYVIQLPSVARLSREELISYLGETVQRYVDLDPIPACVQETGLKRAPGRKKQ